jgi:hypothetical protein
LAGTERAFPARGAFTRAREIKNAAALLRLAPGYGGLGMSLRETCAWAEASGIASLSEVLNAGKKVAVLVGAGARGAAPLLIEMATLLGAGVAKALLGKDVLPDDLPFVTGAIGLLALSQDDIEEPGGSSQVLPKPWRLIRM